MKNAVLMIFALTLTTGSARAAQAPGSISYLNDLAGNTDLVIPAAKPVPITKELPQLTVPEGWQELMDKVSKYGTYSPGPIMPTLGFADIKGPLSASHRASYINQWGGYINETFYVDVVTLVSEEWILVSKGVWCIHQWTFQLTLEGTAFDVTHVALVEKNGGDLVYFRNLPADDPRAQKKLDKLVKKWREFK